MRSNFKYLIFLVLIIFIFAAGAVSANDLDNSSAVSVTDESVNVEDNLIQNTSNEITVNNWDELQLYCSKNDANYVLKLKENTNYYPTDSSDESYQIQVNNNVTIIGSNGAYFGDSSPNAQSITYLPINVPENSGIGITLKGVDFKWISTKYQPNAVFLQMAGNSNNYIENCHFTNSTLDGGHSSLLYLLRGYASISNCTFTNITSDFGVVSIYDPKDDSTKTCTGARMDVSDCYFEANYARTEPGCINNCGVLVVRNSTFYKNTAFQWAGAIHTHGGANTTIYDSNFTANLAGWNGGALYTYSYLQIYNTVFINNNCTTNNGGGAIGATMYVHAPYIYVQDSLFIDNENLCWALSELSTEGTGRGGAISIMDKGAITLLNNTFIENSASIGSAVCVYKGQNGIPDVSIIGNTFINHTRVGDVLVIMTSQDMQCEIHDNVYYNNSIEFSKLKLTADEKVGNEVTLHIDAALKNEKYYDSDILDKSSYDVYVNGQYYETVTGRDFTLNMKNLEKCQVYVVPSISGSKSNEVTVGLPKEYIYVSQKNGNDNNNGSSIESPVATISKACELARSCENIMILDGTFAESDIVIDYNLTVAGEDNVKISAKGNVFTISSGDVTFKNLIFENNEKLSSSNRIIKHTSGILEIKDCTFEKNSFDLLIESGGTLEASGLKFSENKGVLISSNNFYIESSLFENNIANASILQNTLITSQSVHDSKIYNSTFKRNTVKDGCVYYSSSKTYELLVLECDFINNTASYSQDSQIFSSGIYAAGGVVSVKSSAFIDNKDAGSYSSVIYVTSDTYVSDSIFLGNEYHNSNNFVINSKASSNLKKITCNNNWWGNTQENLTQAPKISSSSNCNSWLFLNVSTNATALGKNQKALISLNLNNLVTKSGDVSYYDAGNLNTVTFNIITEGGVADDGQITLVNGLGRTTYTLTSYDGSFSADYNGFTVTLDYSHSRLIPTMILNADSVHVGDTASIVVEFIEDVSGNLTVLGDTKVISASKTVFTLENLNAGENVIEVTYSGDESYKALTQNVTVNVNRYDSKTNISYDDVGVGEDLLLTVYVTDTATGNVTLIINNEEETLTLSNNKAYYTIKSISRGKYNVTAIYNGDSKYASSTDNVIFSVGRVSPTFNISVDDVIYGQDSVVKVVLNTNATGNVDVTVDDKNATSEILNGNADITVSGLNAGLKTVYVSYDGDDFYDSFNASASFSVLKANTTLKINVEDIKIGASQNIEVILSDGVTGNVTIVCGENTITKPVNMIGKVVWTLNDLSAGQYTVSADLISDNYNNVENTADFSVSDYLAPQWPNQGYDIENSGKSPYNSYSNGAILWVYNVNGNVTQNIAVDSEGNILIVTTSGVYSVDALGKERWNYDYVSHNISGIAVSRDVVIVPIAGNSLFFVNQTKGLRYGYSHIYQASSLFSPVVDSDSNIYVSSEYQHASEDYKLVIVPYKLWLQGGNPTLISLGKSQPISAPVIVNDEYAVVTCSDGIKIIDLNKNEISATVSGKTQNVRPVVGSGNIVYTVLNGNIHAMTMQGTSLWKTALPDGGANYLALDGDDALYLVSSLGNLYKYDPVDGSNQEISDLNFTSGMLIGNNGNIYIGLDEMLYAFDEDGNILWKSDMGGEIVGTPVMDKNGIIYITTSNALKAIGSADLAEASIGAIVIDVSYGVPVYISVIIGDDLTGKIIVEIDSKNYTADILQNTMTIKVSNLSAGHKTAKIIYSGDKRFKSKEISCSFNVVSLSQIVAEDATSYYGDKYVISLKDMQGNAIAGAKLKVNVGNIEYNLTTDGDGNVSIVLDMPAGVYQLTSLFEGDGVYTSSSKSTNITVLSTIQAVDMTRGYNSGTDFKATFLTNDGALLSNQAVFFVIDGTVYNLTTDSNGVAVLNAKLAVGSYSITVLNPQTGENTTQKSTIVKRIVSNKDLTMDYLDGSVFKVRIVGDDGNYVGKNQVVSFKIGSKTYTAKTDANGYASIKISLVPKTYTVTAQYKGYKVSNKIVVKQVLKAKNISKKKAKSYKFQATLKTSKGKAIAGKKLTFKIKNKKYTAKTNKKGVATITIKLNLKVGKYTITTTYSKTSIKNKVTIKK